MRPNEIGMHEEEMEGWRVQMWPVVAFLTCERIRACLVSLHLNRHVANIMTVLSGSSKTLISSSMCHLIMMVKLAMVNFGGEPSPTT